MSETSMQSVGETKNESPFDGWRESKNFFQYLVEEWISSAIVENYILKALAIVVGSVKVALLSIMVLSLV